MSGSALEPISVDDDTVSSVETTDEHDEAEFEDEVDLDANRTPLVIMSNGVCRATHYYGGYPTSVIGDHLEAYYLCCGCLGYAPREEVIVKHREHCVYERPPGRRIWQHGKLSLYEVGGKSERAWCQNLALYMKTFIESKCEVTRTTSMLFYVLTATTMSDEEGVSENIVGAFSKFKDIENNFVGGHQNVSCIVVFPEYAGCGYGTFLVQFSYELTAREDRLYGSPERPLSNHGYRMYSTYWQKLLSEKYGIEDATKGIDMSMRAQIVEETHISPHDLELLIELGVGAKPERRIEDEDLDMQESLLPRFASMAELSAFVSANFCCPWAGPAPDDADDVRMSIELYNECVEATLDTHNTDMYSLRWRVCHGVETFVPTRINTINPLEYSVEFGCQLPPGERILSPAVSEYVPMDSAQPCIIVPHDVIKKNQMISIGRRERKQVGNRDYAAIEEEQQGMSTVKIATSIMRQHEKIARAGGKAPRQTEVSLEQRALRLAGGKAPRDTVKLNGGKTPRNGEAAVFQARRVVSSKFQRPDIASKMNGKYVHIWGKFVNAKSTYVAAKHDYVEYEKKRQGNKRKSSDDSDSAESTLGKRPVGIRNPGVRCYVTTAVQMIVAVPPLREHLLSVSTSERWSPVTRALASMVRRMFGKPSVRSVAVEPIESVIELIDDKYADERTQFDTFEFMMSLLCRLAHEEMQERMGVHVENSINVDSDEFASTVVGDLFLQQCNVTRTCLCPGQNVEKYDEKRLFLVAPLKASMNEMLAEACNTKTICPRCNTINDENSCTLVSALTALPKVLVFQAQRVGCDNEILSDKFAYDLHDVDVSKSLFVLTQDNAVYEAMAVSYHKANKGNSGHFCAFAKHNGKFYNFDDARVIECTEQTVRDCAAYSILYVRSDVVQRRQDIAMQEEDDDSEDFDDEDFDDDDNDDDYDDDDDYSPRVAAKKRKMVEVAAKVAQQAFNWMGAVAQNFRGENASEIVNLPSLPTLDWASQERTRLCEKLALPNEPPTTASVQNLYLEDRVCTAIAQEVVAQQYSIMQANHHAVAVFDLISSIPKAATEFNSNINTNVPLVRGASIFNFPSAWHCKSSRLLRWLIDETGLKIAGRVGEQYGMTHVKQTFQGIVHMPIGSHAALKRSPIGRTVDGNDLKWVEVRAIMNVTSQDLSLKIVLESGEHKMIDLPPAALLWHETRTPLRVNSIRYTRETAGTDPISYIEWRFYATSDITTTPGYKSIDELHSVIKKQDVPIMYDVPARMFRRPALYTKATLENKKMQNSARAVARDLLASVNLVATPNTTRREVTLAFHKYAFKRIYGFHCANKNRCSEYAILGKSNKLYAPAPSLHQQSNALKYAQETLDSVKSESYKRYKKRTALKEVEELVQENLMHEEYTDEELSMILQWKCIE